MNRSWLGLALWPFILACNSSTKGTQGHTGETGQDSLDKDGDGYLVDEDCNDLDATINPGVYETCNGIDDDCDGDIDDGIATTWYQDEDGDGFGDPDGTAQSCYKPDGYVPIGTDCDDGEEEIYPGNTELCDGLDNDCDGDIDEGATSGDDTSVWYLDDDGDGYGDLDHALEACGTPDGYVRDATDCDDADEDVHPDADELCNDIDDDCDGDIDDDPVDPTTWYMDADSDDYGDPATEATSCDVPAGATLDGTDCDDAHDDTNPGADEVCDDRDNDCDGSIDEDAIDAETWYTDGDGDGYGDPDSATTSCDAPSDGVLISEDCDDGDSDVYPGASETCNDTDDDCDGSVDESATDMSTWYEDSDSDAYGDPSASTTACDKPTGYVADKTDCDDTASSIYPGATEYCNSKDDDCDGTVDDSPVDRSTWYKDADSDTYGDKSSSKKSCDKPTGYVSDKTDCDDATSSVHPGATELCNDVDDDCDGSVDEDATDTATWYKDGDSDGYGGTTTTTACDKPTGYVGTSTDCDDSDSSIYPGATETCNDEDDDCDGSIDEGAVDASTWYQDADSDAYGNASVKTTSCDKPTGYVSNKTDCDDTASSIYPGATEYCNSKDDDCDGTVDDSPVDRSTWYKDADSDTYGDASTSKKSCDKPTGYVSDKTDCDDTTSSIHPGASEYCNSKDDDCDGSIDESAVDMTTWYKDGDSDTYGGTTSTTSCTKPTGYVSLSSDCDDTSASIYPGATEVCEDGIDQDCDGGDDTCALSGDVSLSLSEARLIGETDFDYAANAISTAGDTNGDGYDDIIVGAYGTGTYNGTSYLVLGPVSGDLDLYYADGKLGGEASNDYSGWSVASAGDVDGDGYDDVLVGAHREHTVGTNSGAAYLIGGPIAGSMSLTLADAKRTGLSASDIAGYSLSGGMDIDLDGYDDVLIGAYQDDSSATSAGALYLCQGPVTGKASLSTCDAKLMGEKSNDNAGWSGAFAGDLDADGVPDLIVSAPGQDTAASNAGAIYVVSGPLSGSVNLSAADARRLGIVSGDLAGGGGGTTPGKAVAGLGDVDGDGYDDVMAGSWNYDVGTAGNAGAAWLLYGPVTGSASLSTADAILQGELSDDRAGVALSAAGDVNADGLADFLIGAYHEDTGGTDAGASYFFLGGAYSGTVSLSTADALFYGENAGDYVGWDVSPGGDVNADGYGDMLIGAWKQDDGGTDAGVGYLVLGGAL